MANINAYEEDLYARFYDWCYRDYGSDIPYYLNLAKEYGGPVLEAACGSGRVAFPLARAGFKVTGIDLSAAMLSQARRKCGSEPKKIRDSMSFIQGDMSDFHLGRAFSCVFVPNASLFNLRGPETLSRCFACLFEHISPGGILAVDLVSPYRMAGQKAGGLTLLTEGVNPVTGLMTREFNRKLEVDRSRQIVRVEHIYTEQAGAEEKRYEFVQNYRWIEESEGLELLSKAGFGQLKTFGDFRGSPFSGDSERLILTGRR